ncbi:MAG: HEPN domain-containing protein [Planctomycetes bacterium]|nr:HEPN domain-containing protein [Planctomycetota bacterium]
MSADALIASLLRVAKEDLEGARLLASAGNRNAIYLCEQAAEKIIRAILTSEAKHAGIKHRLNEMVDMVPDDNPLKPALRAIEYLAAFATSYRYPTTTGRILQPPTGAQFGAAATKVEFALNEAAKRLGVDLTKPGPATKPGPVR